MNDNNITLIEGDDLDFLCSGLGVPSQNRPYRLRIWSTEKGIKVKVNEGMWTPLLGEEEKR